MDGEQTWPTEEELKEADQNGKPYKYITYSFFLYFFLHNSTLEISFELNSQYDIQR